MEPMGKTCRPRGIFTREELKAMFPEERKELIELWGSMEIAVLFYILSITVSDRGKGGRYSGKMYSGKEASGQQVGEV
jgi:hypothetical protein